MSSYGRRLLFLLNLLEKETDDEQHISVKYIMDRMKEEEIKTTKSTLMSDIEVLRDAGYSIGEILDSEDGKKGFYYSGPFDTNELRILVDAVSSARFLTKKQTESIINKLKELTSESVAEKLTSQIYIDERIKAQNSKIHYLIETINQAITESRIITFKYKKYDLNKNFIYRNNGNHYTIIPYGLV
ncbi:helix-turn-helix transcriptional regulator [Heliophilum fasciatum]|uniref:WYL domain-containing protein n=1 Tax=Heliophilum fasciatum TaxID=35700 RepID=A0A4R2RRW8_9FIRM|nr:hypothetical protein [Heliophilum fasciatum]MCW2278648.1 putative DNA-binding transcriptional regulator YafY [Heliophilum fasciatum]TCP62631.1 hypothetical protein EDD73_12049 [Heliophilum fasciatum]